MSIENYNYRTSQTMLRNSFDGAGKLNMPIIKKQNFSKEDFKDLRLIGFDNAKTDRDEHFNRMVHFFLYDYKFETIWKEPDKYINNLSRYRAVLSPDFSMYTDMAACMQIYNTFRNRWCGAYLISKNIKVIPTVNWGLEETFDFCFDGVEKGSAVAVSTYMVSAHDNHSEQKEFFMRGYNEMLRRIEPEKIICYHEPFSEMQGDIIYINYELSSWQHMNDDINSKKVYYKCYKFKILNNTENNIKRPEKYDIITKTGYILSHLAEKGNGNSRGGSWRPSPNKPADQRFIGIPEEIKTVYKNGYKIDTKIGGRWQSC